MREGKARLLYRLLYTTLHIDVSYSSSLISKKSNIKDTVTMICKSFFDSIWIQSIDTIISSIVRIEGCFLYTLSLK